jgi:hypothetical protein
VDAGIDRRALTSRVPAIQPAFALDPTCENAATDIGNLRSHRRSGRQEIAMLNRKRVASISQRWDVRFGSLADIATGSSKVRFVPIAD